MRFPRVKFKQLAQICYLICFVTVLGSCEVDQELLAYTSTYQEVAKDTTETEPIKKDKILVFTKTEGFRHSSIEKGVQTLIDLGLAANFEVTQTENAEDFNDETLSEYKVVLFLSTSGDVLNEMQQFAFRTFIQNGNSFMGIHAAADTEIEWPYYGELVGAYFVDHPAIQSATITTIDKTHISTSSLQDSFTRVDEWYNFDFKNTNIKVLLNLEESSYEGGTNGTDHPIAWYHNFDGGRSFYTGGGHTEEAFDEPEFKAHLLGGILYCLQRDLQ